MRYINCNLLVFVIEENAQVTQGLVSQKYVVYEYYIHCFVQNVIIQTIIISNYWNKLQRN